MCGTPLAVEAPAEEVRKTVSVVFSDLKGSTNLGEQLDTESLREVLNVYFEEMRAVLERHGGTVEKYIGDAIMAVFGLPKLHEDDALRATRAAFEMKQKLEEVNERLEATWGVRLENRTGVNTGEVVAGDVSSGQRLVTGDTVNTAARLEQAAPALEILIGDRTFSIDETFWAARRLLERIAASAPLVVLIDDIHWAEGTFLDLLRFIADSAEAPIVLVCSSRKDLLEEHADWGEDRVNMHAITLEPLSEAESALVLENLLGSSLDDEVRSKVITAAEGNPLFVEQMLSMLIDDGILHRDAEGRWIV